MNLGKLVPKLKLYTIYINIRTLDNLKTADANTIVKGFSNSNLNLRKYLSNIQLLGDQHQISSSTDLCLLHIWRFI